jgi:hypothetical protein
MIVTLGKTEFVTAKDDGGISLSASTTPGITIPPILSIEVYIFAQLMQAKRKKHKTLSSLDTHYAHAAQIYCEMLGQICHSQFYENLHTIYQEVPPSNRDTDHKLS